MSQFRKRVFDRGAVKMTSCLFFLSLCMGAYGQLDQGTITGAVQDTSGAAIANAHVTLSHTDTGLNFQGQTNGSGVYIFSPLKIGNYSVTASAPGFQTTSRQSLHLDLQQRLNVNLTLQPGAVSESVTVSVGTPLLQSQDATVGQVISTETINDTPLNGRN